MSTAVEPVGTAPQAPAYPVRLRAELDPDLSRWMWLLKWLLAIPHYIVLFFLWLAFGVMWVVALVAILFTGRYPQALFDFNLGVLRWSWRVAYYAFAGLGTDKYPPFTLHEVPSYPAGLEVDYPEHLSRGLVLVKWWLLAIPHYLIIGFFAGGGFRLVEEAARDRGDRPGLVALLAFFAVVVLLFKGRYPRGLFDFVMGMNRWGARVAGYAALMTDQYPPMRLDQGGPDPSGFGTAAGPAHVAPAAEPAASTAVRRGGWTPLRIVGLALGSIALAGALALGTAGAFFGWVNHDLRDEDDFLMTPAAAIGTSSYAVVSESLELRSAAVDAPRFFLGDVRLRVEGTGDVPVFVGIADSEDVDEYLRGVGHAVITGFDGDRRRWGAIYEESRGGAPAMAPGEATFWEDSASGAGELTLEWDARPGDWTVVVMNADASAVVAADVAVGATVPLLGAGVAILFVLAAVALVGGLVLVIWAVVSASRSGSATV